MRFFVLAMALVSAEGFAAGVGWLGDAPIRYFTEEDTALMKNAVQKALSGNDNGVVLEWANADTGHKGSITPIDRKTINGLSCRSVQLFNSANGRTANSKYTFCQHEDGTWKLANK